ncbi:MAG: hypothetical protein ISR90_02650 [Candidatus Marinimicrobia bacterium]|nr:hypothetical protein [Candidatus Neomarinimicrobiota bacterium]MBL7022940.1 hypothetical protein [Candidatus Neomarinimicrobiota bacterium]MBL7108758.1 hypothetical protein [Candidatus Neomarinimicrobiota bacterium]
MKLVKVFLPFLLSIIYSQEFNEGPYGTEYYDIAGPFSVLDINLQMQGDVNSDQNLDISDILIITLANAGTIELSDEQFQIADVNSDGLLDDIDLVTIVNSSDNPLYSEWNYEDSWNGLDSYIFICYNQDVSNSAGLWASNTQSDLLDKSPDNVHYFFVSNRTSAENDVIAMKSKFDEVLVNYSDEDKEHWRNHLHFVPTKISDLENWLSDALSDKYALGIDTFQQLKQIGYLGNPNGFTGTHMSYLAHEAQYYNYEQEEFSVSSDDYIEIAIFDSVLYDGWWASTIQTIVEIPSDEILSNTEKMEIELFRPCADYLDSGCDDYDRTAILRVCDEDGSNCNEIARWITPFDRQPHHLTDITPFISKLRPGGNKLFKFQIYGWPNNIVFMKLHLYQNESIEHTPQEIIPLWSGGGFYSEGEPVYNDNIEPKIFEIPSNATKVEFVTYITGHGSASDSDNCAEFCNTRHFFTLNGGVFEFDKSHPEAGASADCQSVERIREGVIPNQYGTWGYGRAGWCPGLDVDPFIQDITDFVELGDENVMQYEMCWASQGNVCHDDWPIITNPSGYLAEIIMSSYIVIYY